MALTPRIKLNAEAKKLGIEGYRQMTLENLKNAITAAKGIQAPKGKTAPAKGKTAVPAKGKTAAKTSTPAKGKTTPAAKGKTAASKSAPAKSTAKKTTPAKATASKGTASRAATKTTTPAKKTTAKAPAKKTTTSRGNRKAPEGRQTIDLKQIDWTAESNVGKTGKRKIVLDMLRKKKDYGKTFDALQDQARTFYKGKSKHDAERMLVWLINRVAFDFVMSTDQHTPGSRQAYGTSTNPAHVRRREARASASKPARGSRSATTSRKAATPVKKATAKKTTAPAKKPTATTKARTAPRAAAKGKTAASRRTVKGAR